MQKKLLFYPVSAVLIYLSLFAGNWIQAKFTLSVPGSVIGLLILFTGLVSGLVKAHWVQPSASILIKYMVLLFIPISVGLMAHFHMLLNNALAIIASTVLSTIFVMILLSFTLDKMLTKK